MGENMTDLLAAKDSGPRHAKKRQGKSRTGIAFESFYSFCNLYYVVVLIAGALLVGGGMGLDAMLGEGKANFVGACLVGVGGFCGVVASR